MKIAKTVYSIYWPETQRVVERLWSENHHDWYEDNYTKKQNEMHQPYLSGWRDWVAKANVKLGKQFKYDYPTNGASEGIQHLLSYFATRKLLIAGKPVMHVFEGEYEGYRKIADALNLRVQVHQRHNYEYIAKCSMPGDVFWISQPSAIDGNVWSDFPQWVEWMAKNAAGISIVVDLTYVGAVSKEFEIVLTSSNIKAVLWSLSKPFGVYYHRIGGLACSFEVPSLYGNYWFKNLFSLHLGTELMKAYGPHELPHKYSSLQKSLLDEIRNSSEKYCYNQKNIQASDVVLLAYQNIHSTTQLDEEFIRVKNDEEILSRYCLSPGIDNYIKAAK